MKNTSKRIFLSYVSVLFSKEPHEISVLSIFCNVPDVLIHKLIPKFLRNSLINCCSTLFIVRHVTSKKVYVNLYICHRHISVDNNCFVCFSWVISETRHILFCLNPRPLPHPPFSPPPPELPAMPPLAHTPYVADAGVLGRQNAICNVPLDLTAVVSQTSLSTRHFPRHSFRNRLPNISTVVFRRSICTKYSSIQQYSHLAMDVDRQSVCKRAQCHSRRLWHSVIVTYHLEPLSSCHRNRRWLQYKGKTTTGDASLTRFI